MAHFKGEDHRSDAGFYLRDCHVSLIREGWLIAGVNYLSELPPKLRQAVLLMDGKVPMGTTAETLAQYKRTAASDSYAYGLRTGGDWPEIRPALTSGRY